jgi:hypothetical protein
MRWTIIAALLGALLLAPAAHAAGPIQIIRDCEDDGVLQGNYSASDLRKARSNLPTDIDEYSDCRDVLSRAIAAKTQTAGGGPDTSGGGAPTGGSTGGGGGSGGGGGTGGAGGGGGAAGGGSFAVYNSASTVTIANSILTAGAGGAGGDAGAAGGGGIRGELGDSSDQGSLALATAGATGALGTAGTAGDNGLLCTKYDGGVCAP